MINRHDQKQLWEVRVYVSSQHSGHIPSVIKVRADNEDRNLETGTKAEAGEVGWGWVSWLAQPALSYIPHQSLIKTMFNRRVDMPVLLSPSSSQMILAYAKLTKQNKTTRTPTIKRHSYSSPGRNDKNNK